jgi:hypothetical protein
MRDVTPGDWPEVAAWYRIRGDDAPPLDMMPASGAIVPGVAAGYMYQTNSKMCMLEGFITNPLASPEERSAAIDEIARALIAKAEQLGFTYILALTDNWGIGRRAIDRHSFVRLGNYEMLIRRSS